jgi:ABC-type uncharacterized transport system involved in gliding motility auxiliary subunit
MNRAQLALAAAAILAAATFANVIAARLGWRADLTEDRLFTLSEPSRRLAAGVGETVEIEFFASRGETKLSPYLEAYARRAEGLLREYAEASGGRVRVTVTDPQPDTEAESRAQRHGLGGVRADGGTAYLGLTARQADTLRALPFLDPRRERFLEHDVSQLIASVVRLTKPRLVLVSTLPITSELPPSAEQPGPGDILLQELGRSFEVVTLPNTSAELPKDTAVVALLHPHHLNPRLAFAIDQFLLGGGPVLAAIDPLSRFQKFQQGNLPFMIPGAAMGAASDPALAKAWGVDVPVDAVVGDAARSLQMPSARGEPVTYPPAAAVEADGLNREHPLTADLGMLNVLDAGSVRLVPEAAARLRLTPLASFRGPGVGQVAIAAANAGPFERVAAGFRPDGQERVLAALVTGKFATAFPEGAPQDPAAPAGAPAPAPAAPALKASAKEGRLIVIADSDFALDYYSLRRGTAYGQQVYEPVNDNHAFLIGALESLAGNADLAGLRAKGAALRPFDKVLDLQRAAQARYQVEIDRNEERLNELGQKLAELTRAQGGDLSKGIVVTPEVEQEVRRFTEEQAEVRRALRDIRRAARVEIDDLGRRLAVLNLLAGPLLAVLAGLGYAVLRRRRSA